jgi:hypothetical protein
MKIQILRNVVTRNVCALAIGLAAVSGGKANADLIYGVSDSLGQLVTFNSASPDTLISAIALTGMASGEQIRGIDYVSGVLYGLGDASHLYTINPNTGVCTLISAFTPVMNGVDFGFTTGPSQFYVSSDLGQNFSLTGSGVATVGPNYSPAGVSLDTLAYNPLNTTFYAISAFSHDLYSVNPTTGATSVIGPTGVNFVDRIGLSISPAGSAYFSATVAGQTEFFTVNLGTGALTLVGNVGVAGEFSSGLNTITIAPTPVPEPGAAAMAAMGGALLFAIIRFRK